MAKEFTVDPWRVEGNIDYSKLVKQFGTTPLSGEVTEKLEKIAGKHPFVKRGMVVSHRDLGVFLNEFQTGKKIALYTGRGPSGNMHLGHLMPLFFTKHLQDAFRCDLYFQLTDDEKFLFNKTLSRKDVKIYSYENLLDIVAVGFDPKLTKIIVDTEQAEVMYPLSLEFAKKITASTAKAVFGFGDDSSIGEFFFTSMQSVPCILPSLVARSRGEKNASVRVLIPHAIDQDPHFRVTRDVIEKLGYPKPSGIHLKFMPSLSGGGKMSASNPESAIYTTDDSETVERKISKAYTGGRSTAEEQRKYGGNPEVCSVCNYLKFFFEEDDDKLEKRMGDYRKGRILDGENKKYLTEKVNAFLKKHQEARERARGKLEKFTEKLPNSLLHYF